jgi:cobalt-zinc-cadmium efflux system protein
MCSGDVMGSSDAHTHGHDHGGGSAGGHAHAHSHAPSSASLAGDAGARRALWIALLLGAVVLVAEVIAGVVFGSLALLGDAAHMLTDVGAYAIALWAARMASRPPTASATFGSGRIEILAALVNGATLLAASVWIIVEAVRRLVHPTSIDGGGMSVVAAIGLAMNIIVLVLLLRTGSSSLNVRGAMLHAAGDVLGSVAALVAGILIATLGWERADPIASILLTVLIAVSAWHLVRDSTAILLDVAPHGVDADVIGNLIVSVPGVRGAHDVHVWTMSPGVTAVSAHVTGERECDPDLLLDAMRRALADNAGVGHTTFQLRVERSVPLQAVPRMELQDAVDWATEHIARARPELSRAVIAAAAGAAAIGIVDAGMVSPVAVSQRTARSLNIAPEDLGPGGNGGASPAS